MDVLIAYRTIDGCGVQISIAWDSLRKDRFVVTLMSRECEPEDWRKEYRTLDAAQRSCRRRFGVLKSEWKNAFQVSRALPALREFADGQSITELEFEEAMRRISGEFILAEYRCEYRGRTFVIEDSPSLNHL